MLERLSGLCVLRCKLYIRDNAKSHLCLWLRRKAILGECLCSINCSGASFGNSIPSRWSGRSSICNASSRTASSSIVSLNSCSSFNLFRTLCCSLIALLNLIFCPSAVHLPFALIKVSFEERLDEQDADDIHDDLHEVADGTDVILSFSIAFILYNAAL